MNCPRLEEILQQYLDGEPTPEQSALDQHLTECRDCREQHAAARRLREGLQLMSPPAPPVGLVDQIVARVQQDQGSRLRFRRRFLAIGALAASILALVMVRMSLPQSGSDQNGFAVLYDRVAVLLGRKAILYPSAGGPEIVEFNPAPVPEKEEPPPSLRDSVADASSAVVGLTRRTADSTVGQGRVLVPEPLANPTLSPPETMPPDMEPTAKSLREASQGAASGLEPVTSSARRAFSLFLREIPAVEPAEQK